MSTLTTSLKHATWTVDLVIGVLQRQQKYSPHCTVFSCCPWGSPMGNQPWIFIGRTDAEVPIFWWGFNPSHPNLMRRLLIGRDPDAGKDWRQEEKGATEDEMFGWHHQFSGHESEQTLGDSEGQGSLESAVYGGCRVRHNLVTEQQLLLFKEPVVIW